VQVEVPSRGEMVSVYAGTAPLQADQEATVVAKVGGEVRELLVEEGDHVKAGQVLARLDGDRLRFELQQTEVNLRKLEREYQRTLELFNRKLVASQAVDNARSEMEWLKAARDLAQLNVGYTEIRAPIAGVISARHIKVGNTINVNDRTFQVTDLDPLIAITNIRTMTKMIDLSVAQPRFTMLLLGVFGAVALTLAVVGIYGIMAHAVKRRTREIGIRMALGARPADVLRLVVGQGMRLAVLGLVVGVVAALAATRLMADLLFGVKATDPLTYAGSVVVLGAVAFAASWIPARRAIAIDPTLALRSE